MAASDLVVELRVILEERANGGDESKVKRCHPERKKREKKNPCNTINWRNAQQVSEMTADMDVSR